MANTEPRSCAYEYEAISTIEPDAAIPIDRPTASACPHTVVDTETNRCLFHQVDPEYPVDRITEQFQEAIGDATQSPTFAGGQLSGLHLEGAVISTPDGHPIDLRGTTIDGDLDLTDATVEVPLLLDEAAITGSFIATDAEFTAPLSLVGTNIGRRCFLQRAVLAGGIVGNALNAGYLDARGVIVDGPCVFDDATFSADVLLAQSRFDGSLRLSGTTFERNVDAISIEVDGSVTISQANFGGEFDLIASEITGDFDARSGTASGDVDCRHLQLGGDLEVSDTQFDGETQFEGLVVEGNSATFADSRFTGKSDFSNTQFQSDTVLFTDTVFDGEAWFTYAAFDGDVAFRGAEWNAITHLRDATFKGDLSLDHVRSSGQLFLHGSTIHGAFSAADATFNHMQFSATVHGDADFSRAKFDEIGLFPKSEFRGKTTFELASFAGTPDFSDSRFAGPTSFERTEFLVEPDFENARFAIDPDLDAARYPMPASRNLDEMRTSMILARPESLEHTGLTIPAEEIDGDIVIPAHTDHLIEDDVDRTKIVTKALSDLDGKEWHRLFEDAIRTARTAVAQLSSTGETVMVFGLSRFY